MTSNLKKRPTWQECQGEIEDHFKSLDRILIASDFDGTLSGLVDRPDDAMLEPGAVEVISNLIDLPQVTLAFLSGRSLLDLKSRIGLDESRVIFAGNHGFEMSGIGPYWLHPAAVSIRPHLDSLIARFAFELLEFDNSEIEDKGSSLSLHYRRMKDEQKPALREMIYALSLPMEIKLHEGNNVFEFRPNVDWNKGTALRRIMGKMDFNDQQTLYLGDDITDEDIFRELDQKATTVHVGVIDKPSSAKMNAENPADATAFLSYVLKQILFHK